MNLESKDSNLEDEDIQKTELKKDDHKKSKVSFKRPKKIVILVIILIVLVVAGFRIKQVVDTVKKSMGNMKAGNTFELTKRNISDAVRITGTIASASTKSVVCDVSNVKILKMNVEVGDTVKEGDVICILDSSILEAKLENLKKNMNVTDANSGMTVDESLRDRDKTVYDANVNVSQAQNGITDAQEKYNQAYYNCCYAKSDYDKAREKYDFAVSDKDNAGDALDKAKEALEKAKREYDDSTSVNSTEEEKIKELEAEVKTAETLYDSSCTAVDAADTAKETARRAYETACNNLASYERNVDEAVQKKDSTMFDFAYNYTNKNDSIQKNQLADSVDNLNAKLDAADLEDQIAQCTIKAPISGRITAVGVEEGRKYTGTQICAIQDDKDLIVEAIVDQYDIADIEEGQTAIIRTDATGSQEMEGTVTFVSPTPKTETNATTLEVTMTTDYPIKITLKEKNSRLRLGMTAKINILLSSAKDVYAVPYECIHEDSDGKTYITEVEGSTISESNMVMTTSQNNIYVSTGLETDYYTEVSANGLKEGMQILVPPSEEDTIIPGVSETDSKEE